MKIGQVAPLMESVPPRLYGGTERIVSYLTEELVRMGHEVTLFASGDSITSAQLVGCVPTAIRLDANIHDSIPYYMLMLDRVRDAAEDFDILHFHIDQFHFPLFKSMANRTVTTLHGRQDLPDLKPLYLGFPEMPLISISDAQREPVLKANFVATVHHGIPPDLYRPNFDPRGGYVAFLGRISPEKRPDRAIRIAQTLGIPLRLLLRLTAPTKPISVTKSSRCCSAQVSNLSGKSTSAPKPGFSVRPVPSCFRWTGRSRSAS
jgi:hypothetical protein